MRHFFVACCGLIGFSLVTISSVPAGITGTTLVANAGQSILTATADPTDPNRLLVGGRTGQIQVLDLASGQFDNTPFLTIPGVSTLGSEGGLLGLALHPNYANNGLGYAYITTTGGAFNAGVSRIISFQRDPSDPTRALSSSITQLLEFDQPQGNHNGGWIGFSPNDDLLYIASGDGGSANDLGTGHTPGIGNAQDLTNNLLGKILRIDVNGDDFPTDPDRNYAIPDSNPFVGVTGDDEIWSYGLRNPFRNSFDRQTGDLLIADVGQNVLEEINLQPGDSAGGENYGWRLREGAIATPSGGVGGAAPAGAIDPIYDYTHGGGLFQGNSVTGGVIYRGPDATLDGQYLFADFVSDNFWTFDPADPDGTVDNINAELFSGSEDADNPVGFVEDLAGNVFILTLGGDIVRIDTAGPGDFNGDGFVNAADYVVLRDGALPGGFDSEDFDLFADNFSGVSVATTGTTPSTNPIPEPSGMILVAIGGMGLCWHRLT